MPTYPSAILIVNSCRFNKNFANEIVLFKGINVDNIFNHLGKRFNEKIAPDVKLNKNIKIFIKRFKLVDTTATDPIKRLKEIATKKPNKKHAKAIIN